MELEGVVAVLFAIPLFWCCASFYWRIIRVALGLMSGDLELPFEIRRKEARDGALLPNEEGGY
jgi:hypothetical protein